MEALFRFWKIPLIIIWQLEILVVVFPRRLLLKVLSRTPTLLEHGRGVASHRMPPHARSMTALCSHTHISHLGRVSLTIEGEFALQAFALDADGDDLARQDFSKEDALGQGILNVTLDSATQRAGTKHRVEATVGQ